MLKSGNKHHKVYTQEIIYIKSLKDYIKIHIKNEKHIVAKYKIGDIENKLKDKQFLRIHRSYIININKITAFIINEIEVDSVEILIGISYREKAIDFLNKIIDS